jgi:Fe-S oxidoreductase
VSAAPAAARSGRDPRPAAAIVVVAGSGGLAYLRYHTASPWFAGGWHAALVAVTVVAAVAFIWGLWRHVAMWLSGGGTLRIDRVGHRLRRVVEQGILQRKVRRDPLSGYVHLALSVVFALLLLWYTLRSIGLPVGAIPWAVIDVLYLVLGVAAAAALAIRASGARPRLRRDHGDFAIVLIVLGIAVSYFVDRGIGLDATHRLADTAPGSEPSRFVHVLFISSFFVLVPYTKLFHVIAAPLGIFLARHEVQGVPPLPFNLLRDSEEAIAAGPVTLGAAKLSDFAPYRLVSLDACTSCGRCTAVCPATASEKPLAPMTLVAQLGRAARADASASPWDAVTVDEVISCTTCGACVQECPVFIDHIGLITDLRRNLADEGRMQEGHALTARRLVDTDNPWGLPRSTRGTWAESAGFEQAVEGEHYDYLYWLGCAASFDARAQEIAKTVHGLLKKAGLRVATLGSQEQCSGENARRMGEEGLFQRLARANSEAIKRIDATAIVTHCPHCLHSISNEYALLGEHFEIRHHTDVLAELVDGGALKLGDGKTGKVTYHDPCYLGRHNGVFDAPRALLDAVPTIELTEMEKSREKSFCCGAGGASMWQGGELGKRINLLRAEQALATGAETIATGCPFCTAMLEEALQSKGAESVKVRDVAELVAEAVE